MTVDKAGDNPHVVHRIDLILWTTLWITMTGLWTSYPQGCLSQIPTGYPQTYPQVIHNHKIKGSY